VGGEAILTQSVPTVAGAAYSLYFWLANGTGNPNNFSVNWNGTVLMSLTDSASQPYTHYQFDVVGADTNSALEFVFRQDPSYWNLDDVSVTSMDNQLIDIGFGTGVADARTGYGTDAVGTRDRGILDPVDLRTGFSIQTLNIADLSSAAGDEALGDMITQVDKALARMTDAATALGAGKTQIAGQATFVEALIKANERSIGILVDADIEEEATRLKALQAQQQLGIQSLSIANASSQGITSLFR
jgi:flagellin